MRRNRVHILSTPSMLRVCLGNTCPIGTCVSAVDAKRSTQVMYGNTGNLRNECADHAAALGTFGLVSSQTLVHVGLVITLILPLVLVLATTLETSWKNCVTSELKQHRYFRTGVSAVFLIGLSMTLTHIAPHVVCPHPVSRAKPFYCTLLYL